MEPTYLRERLAEEFALLAAAAREVSPTAPVPDCPGWTAADLITHVTHVYLHKTESMRRGKSPEPWPPDLSGEEPLAALDRAYAQLAQELATRPPEEPSPTWYEPDQSVGFWTRRMVHETIVHRIDAERSAGSTVSPVAADLAADNVDEALTTMLVYGYDGWPEDFAAVGRLAEPVTIVVGDSSFTVRQTPEGVIVDDGRDAGATVSGEPVDVVSWLWGRGGAASVRGNAQHAAQLRKFLQVATQ